MSGGKPAEGTSTQAGTPAQIFMNINWVLALEQVGL